jgi:hypothetical protein
MAAGFPYPQTNDGFHADPRVELVRSTTPIIGAVWSNIGKEGDKHCVIPERIDYLNDIEAISVYESVPPVSMRTTRYSNITSAIDRSGNRVANGADYYNKYGAAVYHLDAVQDMSNIPYWDADTATVTGGSARPYRGDKSVYTSEMGSVLINIKDDATELHIEHESGQKYVVGIISNQIDVRAALRDLNNDQNYDLADGIWYVWTDTNETKESFEYIDVNAKKITGIIRNGKLTLSRNDFWYMSVTRSHKLVDNPYW